ncbi:hypothetical protein BH20ACI1_BH20ACI1_26750 [soil metagenome]
MSGSNATNEADFLEIFDDEDLNELIPKVYSELKRLAAYHLQNERPNHTLRPTELVHEVYLLLQKQRSLSLNDKIERRAFGLRRASINYAIYRKA